MMEWQVIFLKDAEADAERLNKSVKLPLIKNLQKVAKNPLPKNEGGYGEPLGNKNGLNLTGLLKIKFRKSGLRIVYKLIKTDLVMKIIVISARADGEVYQEAYHRRIKYDL